MIKINKYKADKFYIWNDFLENSKNGIFLFHRDYMEYHSDRFADHSLMFYNNHKLVGIMPAHSKDGILYSHNGLTFGGLIYNHKMRLLTMLELFKELISYLKDRGFKKIYYKAIPYIYHGYPSDEDLYALKLNNFELVRRDVSSAIYLNEKIPFSRSRKKNIQKSLNEGIEINQSQLFRDFMLIAEKNTQNKYNTNPTHNGAEIEFLARNFPENIKLFVAESEGEILSGVLIYESQNVVHAQYQSSTEKGLEYRASDLIFDFLINFYKDKKYFDFGISTEDNGNFLNSGLIDFKERFGARAVAHDFYELNIP
jgi:hypothetical protein